MNSAAADPKNLHSCSIKLFGVGDGQPSPDRNHSSCLYRMGGATILMDCGDNAGRSFKAAGLNYDSIDAILLSHLHCDHIGGFFMLMQGFWLERRKRALPVHLPEDGMRPIRDMLDASMIFEEVCGFDLQFNPWVSGQTVRFRSLEVTPFLNTHLESLKRRFQKQHPLKFESFSFVIESGPLRIVHSADLGAPGDLDRVWNKPVDLLVCELAHFTPEEMFRYLSGKPLRKVAFVHLFRDYWKNQEELQSLAAKWLGGVDWSFPKDGDEIAL